MPQTKDKQKLYEYARTVNKWYRDIKLQLDQIAALQGFYEQDSHELSLLKASLKEATEWVKKEHLRIKKLSESDPVPVPAPSDPEKSADDIARGVKM